MNARPPQGRPKICAFCGSVVKKLTREHIFPNWLRIPIPRKKSYSFHETLHHHYKNPGDLFPDIIIKKGSQNLTGDPSSRKLEVLCASCNNIWSKNIVTEIKDTIISILQGRNLIYANEKVAISRWCTLCTMLFELTDKESMITTKEDRKKFQITSCPPDDWSIWICKADRDEFHDQPCHRAFAMVEETENGTKTSKAQYNFFGIGNIVFATTSGRFRGNPLPYGELLRSSGMQALFPHEEAVIDLGRELVRTDDLMELYAFLSDYVGELVGAASMGGSDGRRP